MPNTGHRMKFSTRGRRRLFTAPPAAGAIRLVHWDYRLQPNLLQPKNGWFLKAGFPSPSAKLWMERAALQKPVTGSRFLFMEAPKPCSGRAALWPPAGRDWSVKFVLFSAADCRKMSVSRWIAVSIRFTDLAIQIRPGRLCGKSTSVFMIVKLKQ